MVDNRDAGFAIQGTVLEKYTGTAEHVVVPNSITTIGDGAFEGHPLASVDIPDSVMRIGSAFNCCRNLTTVRIPDSVEAVSGHAFDNCKNLVSVHVGAAVSKMGLYVFHGCSRLEKITVSDANTVFSAQDGVLFSRNLKTLRRCPPGITGPYSIPHTVTKIIGEAFSGCIGMTAVAVPASVTAIPSGCFAGCTGLRRVSLPESVRSIDKYAFSNCTSLETIVIPGLVEAIGLRAFTSCSALESVVMPTGLKKIGVGAFEYCVSLKTVVIPDSVTEIGGGAFWGCTSLLGPDGLSTLDIPSSVVSVGGHVPPQAEFHVDRITYRILDAKSVSVESVEPSLGEWDEHCEVMIPATAEHNGHVYSVVEIGGDAFTDCRERLARVGIPDSVERIRGGAFSVCENLTRVTLPDSVTTIGDCAFSDCSGLALLNLGSGLISIGNEAFYGCRALASVVIPASLISIGEDAFPSKTKLIRPKRAKTEPGQRASDVPITREGNTGGPLFGETIVFTGALEMPRREAADLAARAGCKVLDNVTKATTVLVVGDQDLDKLHGHEKSSKHRKAEELAAASQPIRIIRESEFLGLVAPG